MNIKEICIGDGRINEYKLENQTLAMIIEDYAGALYEVVMTQCSHIFVKGSVGFSLSEGRFTRDGTGDHWCFYDEDGAVMEIKFKGYAIRKL